MAAQFKSKADKLLGLDDQTDNAIILVQKEGWLRAQSQTSKVRTWHKLWAVVKDAYILFYSHKDESLPFNYQPKFVLPLGGAVASLEVKDRRYISIKHPDVPNASYRFKAENPGESMDWVVAIEQGKKATWENALLGNALIEKMETVGSAMEEEKQAAFEELQAKATRLDKERDQKEKVMARDAERSTAFKQKLSTEKDRVEQLERKKTTVASKLSKQARTKNAAAKKRMSVEAKLQQAEKALRGLEEAMIIRNANAPTTRFAREDTEVRASVGALRSFFEARADEQAVRAKATYQKPKFVRK